MVCQSASLPEGRPSVVGVEKSRRLGLQPRWSQTIWLITGSSINSVRCSSATLIVLKLHDPLNVDFWRQDFDKCPEAGLLSADEMFCPVYLRGHRWDRSSFLSPRAITDDCDCGDFTTGCVITIDSRSISYSIAALRSLTEIKLEAHHPPMEFAYCQTYRFEFSLRGHRRVETVERSHGCEI